MWLKCQAISSDRPAGTEAPNSTEDLKAAEAGVAGLVVIPSNRAFDPAVHLAYADVRIDSQVSPQMLEVRLKASKTDPFRRGVTIYIGRTGDGLCPVAAALDSMIRHYFSLRRYFTRDRFVVAVRMALRRAGLVPTWYAGHSFWTETATTAAQDLLIKMLGERSLHSVCQDIPGDTERCCKNVSRTGQG